MNIQRLRLGYDMGAKFVQMHNLSGDRALEIGYGLGSHTLAYAEKFNHIDAIDIVNVQDMDMLREISPAVAKVNYLHMNAHNIGLESGYDLVYSLSTFEHLTNWRLVYSHVIEQLKDKGLFHLVISSLYYSPLGHHLDTQIGEWDHLLIPEEKLKQKLFDNGGNEKQWENYLGLNKFIAAEFLELAEQNFETLYWKTTHITLHYLGRKK